MANAFPVCPHCGWYVLPQGMIVFMRPNGHQRFCSQRGGCSREACPACGDLVNLRYHSQWECDLARKTQWIRQLREENALDKREVLCEAEAILREARRDE